MRKEFYTLAILLACVFIVPYLVFGITSSNYEMIQGTTELTRLPTTSTSFAIDSAIQPMVGSLTSGSYRMYVGFVFDPNAGDTGGGGGGGGTPPPVVPPIVPPPVPVIPDPPQLDQGVPLVVFTETVLLEGTVQSSVNLVFINETTAGVTLDGINWSKIGDLILGLNDFRLVAKDVVGFSDENTVTIKRKTLDPTDDYDLSRLVSHWQEDFTESDYDENNIVNDADLSILIAFWDYE